MRINQLGKLGIISNKGNGGDDKNTLKLLLEDEQPILLESGEYILLEESEKLLRKINKNLKNDLNIKN